MIIYITYHLLREPETAIETTTTVFFLPLIWFLLLLRCRNRLHHGHDLAGAGALSFTKAILGLGAQWGICEGCRRADHVTKPTEPSDFWTWRLGEVLVNLDYPTRWCRLTGCDKTWRTAPLTLYKNIIQMTSSRGWYSSPDTTVTTRIVTFLLRGFPWKSTFETFGAFILGMVSVQELRTLNPESVFFLCILHHGFVVFMSIFGVLFFQHHTLAFLA